MSHEWALQMHGFYADTENKTVRFDVVLSFDVNRDEAMETITKEVQEQYPDYELNIVPDLDATD